MAGELPEHACADGVAARARVGVIRVIASNILCVQTFE
jgi:hypothetical protein